MLDGISFEEDYAILPRIFRSILLALGLTTLSVGYVFAERAIPDDNLAYPVLITVTDKSAIAATTSSGSGFFLEANDAVYLVTAKHVLFVIDPRTGRFAIDPKTQKLILIGPDIELLSYSKSVSDSNQNKFTLDGPTLQTNGDIRPHPSHDVAVIKIGTIENVPPANQNAKPPAVEPSRTMKFVPGVVATAQSPLGVVGVAPKLVKKFDDVLIGNDVIVFGYPVSLAPEQNSKLDRVRPLLRKGIVAGTNPALRAIILDSPVYQGVSGGPVAQITDHGFSKEFDIIGVITEFVPFDEQWVNAQYHYANLTVTNSGYSIAEPMDFVMDLIK